MLEMKWEVVELANESESYFIIITKRDIISLMFCSKNVDVLFFPLGTLLNMNKLR